MPRSSQQKLKLLYVLRYLMRSSDERHPVTVAQIIEELERCGVRAERKSIYDDIESLRLFGIDIIAVKSRAVSYYIGERDFELPELKLLVDSIQSSKFITQKKTVSLIKKIESLASAYDAQLLERQVYVRGRVKSMNESIYYNVDEISGAISQDSTIRFRYFEYTVDRQRRFRHDGAYYEVSPFALMWDDENYYLLAWDAAAELMKHYRVDKMTDIHCTGRPREGKEAFQKVDMSSYSTKVFSMFNGEESSVRLRFDNGLVGAVIDRFGKDCLLIPDGDDHFTVTVNVAVSPQFFAWVFGFGPEAEILSPESVREAMALQTKQVSKLYRRNG